MFGIVGNVALLFAGQALTYYSKPVMGLSEADSFGVTLTSLVNMVVISGALLAAVYFWMTNYLMKPTWCCHGCSCLSEKGGKTLNDQSCRLWKASNIWQPPSIWAILLFLFLDMA